MRLISRFKDYYDGAGRADLEREPLYLRETASIGAAAGDLAVLAAWGDVGRRLAAMHAWQPDLAPALLLACGEAHPLVVTTADVNRRGFWTVGQIREHVRARCPPRSPSGMWEEWAKSEYPRDRYDRTSGVFAREPVVARLWLEQPVADVGAEHHRREEAPLLLLWRGRASAGKWRVNEGYVLEGERNPNLRDLGFAPRCDPSLLWQKIDTYLGNEMARQVDPLPLADVYRRDAHGFDKTSFKQPAPGERKARRAARKAAAR